ncbi:DNA-binding protein [Actinocorallia aurea]
MNETIDDPSEGATAQDLKAGAYLHPDTADPGEGVPVTARAYRRPGLPGRTVVRLVPERTGAAEDAAAAFHGLERFGPAEVVGFGAGRSVAFPEWVLVHHPQDAPRALALLPEIDRLSGLAAARPQAALDGFLALGERLAESLPHLLPTYFERAAREFVAARQPACAVRMFGAARKAEDVHGLPIDWDRLDDVFTEFSLTGLLPSGSLSDHSRELALRLPADEALARYLRLAVRRTSGGVPPAVSMASDVRRLAKAASADTGRIERDHLAELLTFPATALAPQNWWTKQQATLKALAAERPEIRRVVLDLTPAVLRHLTFRATWRTRTGLVETWIGVLEASGAASLLAEGEAGEGGAVDFLECLLEALGEDFSGRSMPLETLITPLAGRLRAEIAERGAPPAAPRSAELLDLLLALGLPVAGPSRRGLSLTEWTANENRRDLAALGADPRFAEGLRDEISRAHYHGPDHERVLYQAPALRPHVRGLAVERAGRVAGSDLPTWGVRLGGLQELRPEILRTAGAEARTALRSVDPADLLARTLRGGLFAELVWPAFEEAMAGFFPPDGAGTPLIAEEWPYLVLADDRRAVVLDGSGVVLDHELHVPARRPTGFRYVDGRLLVQWRAVDGEISGYWHTAPHRVLRLAGDHLNRQVLKGTWRFPRISLEAPDGGRLTGTSVIRPGKAAAPGSAELVSDGEAFWARVPQPEGPFWHRLDPGTGRPAEPGMPDFFAEPGEAFLDGFLAPLPEDGPTPVGAVVGGLFGQRTVRLPDGTARGEDLAGRATPAVAGYDTLWPLTLPGDDAPRALARSGDGNFAYCHLIGPDGLVLAETWMSGGHGERFRIPPAHYWVRLRPRDERGSKALRRVDRDLAARLMAGPQEAVEERVRAELPDVGDTVLIEGVARAVVDAMRLAAQLTDVAKHVEDVLRPVSGLPAERPASPGDHAVFRAVDGLREDQSGRYFGSRTTETAHLLWRLAGFREGRYGQAGAWIELPVQDLDLTWAPDALAAFTLLAATGIVPEPSRAALRELLALLDAAGLVDADPAAWRLFRVRPRTEEAEREPRRGYQREGGAFFAVVGEEKGANGAPTEYWAVCHDPSGGFEAPGEYEVLKVLPYAENTAGIPVAATLALLDAQGPAPWHAGPAKEFARLTGATPTVAGLVVSGLIGLSGHTGSSQLDGVRKALGRNAAETEAAQASLRTLPGKVRRALVGALLPADPALLWSRGPDVAAAADVWNRSVPWRTMVPEDLLTKAEQELGSGTGAQRHLRAVLDPENSPGLSRDLEFKPRGYGFEPVVRDGFTADVLESSVRSLAWLAHRLPAGDRLRKLLPEGLAAVRERLAHPGLVLGLPDQIDIADFKQAAGEAPEEKGDGWERYGAILLKTGVPRYRPGLLAARLAEEPRLPLLRGEPELPHAVEIAFRTALDERFAALLADPGDPAEGDRLKDGTWYPQDPSRSVPGVVAEAAERCGVSRDAAAVYLMLLAMPDPTDRNTARWTGWRPARLAAARKELAATDLVVMVRRPKAGRGLFLPCPWAEAPGPRVPMEEWKHALYPFSARGAAPLTTVVPTEPVADVYRRAWRRITEGDRPHLPAEEPPPGPAAP